MAKKLKFLQLLKHKEIRPTQIVNVYGILHPTSDGQISCVYVMHDLINGMHYGGKHLDSFKAYWSSTTDKQFQEVLLNPESQIEIEIKFWGTEKEATDYEHNLLKEVNAADSSDWYNKTNGAPGVKPINFDAVNELKDDINKIRDNFSKKNKSNINGFNTINFDYLTEPIFVTELHKYKRLQVREKSIDRENIESIKSIMRITSTHKLKYHPPVVLKNRWYDGVFYKELLISGNHTIVAPIQLGKHFAQSKYQIILIPEEIHNKFSDSEIYLVANDLNSQKDIYSKFKKEDAVKECLFIAKKGNDWQSEKLSIKWIKRGLTESNVDWVYKQVAQKMLDKKMLDDGYTIMDYKITHKDVLEKEFEKYENDDTFVISYAAAAVKLNRILLPFHLDNDISKMENKNPKNKIVCLLTFNNKDVLTKEWPKLKNEFMQLQTYENFTPIEFIELPMYTKDII
jgi:hypothetical protein